MICVWVDEFYFWGVVVGGGGGGYGSGAGETFRYLDILFEPHHRQKIFQ